MTRSTLISLAILSSLCHVASADNDYFVRSAMQRFEEKHDAVKKKAIIFEVLSDDDGWTVRRYVFKGNKLVSTTSKGYLLKPGAKAFR